MLRKTYLLVVAAAIGILTFPLSSNAQDEVSLLKSDTCFTGPFSSYERWMNVISGGSREKAEDFEERLTRNTAFYKKEQFENYRETIDCRTMIYKVDDAIVDGFYIAPSDQSDLPVVIYNRGGNATYGAWIFGNVYLRLFDIAKEHNVAIFATNYRGVFPTLPGNDEFGGEDVKDVLALPQLFSEFPAVNPEKVAVYGESRGGMQSLLALKQGLQADAAVLFAGQYDFVEALKHRPEMEKVYRARIPNYEENKAEALKKRSAIHWVGEIDKDIPVLLIHGEQDQRVLVDSSIALNKVLEAEGFKHKLSVYEGLGHQSAPKRKQIVAEMISWFKQHWD
ncbi:MULTISPECIES: alpha/beta hydrolase family protein [Idiomarina]|nr:MULTISPECIES: prolyl oligopeptidase family serine peptidase [Idiomarina]